MSAAKQRFFSKYPVGDDEFSTWMKEVCAAVAANTPIDVEGVFHANRTPDGWWPQITTRRGGVATSNNFPFKIYSASVGDAETDWRTVRVRAGAVFVDWEELTAAGTDEVDIPDSSVSNAVNEIVCAEDVAQYWIWLDITASTATVSHGDTPPVWSSAAIPIGWVDTLTEAASNRIVIRQFVRADIFTCL